MIQCIIITLHYMFYSYAMTNVFDESESMVYLSSGQKNKKMFQLMESQWSARCSGARFAAFQMKAPHQGGDRCCYNRKTCKNVFFAKVCQRGRLSPYSSLPCSIYISPQGHTFNSIIEVFVFLHLTQGFTHSTLSLRSNPLWYLGDDCIPHFGIGEVFLLFLFVRSLTISQHYR